MARYQAGEIDAFDRLYGLLAPRLRAFLAARTRSAEQADELLQEAFLQMHRARHTYDTGAPLLPWAFAITRHVLIDAYRSHARRGITRPLDDDGLMAPSPEDDVLARRELERALARLPAGRRLAIVMHHLMGLDFGEVAVRLGIAPGAARLRASRGIAALRRTLIYYSSDSSLSATNPRPM
jgi:RNA polymerase sigma-70 factor (ECF subfamily)